MHDFRLPRRSVTQRNDAPFMKVSPGGIPFLDIVNCQVGMVELPNGVIAIGVRVEGVKRADVVPEKLDESRAYIADSARSFADIGLNPNLIHVYFSDELEKRP
jgi:hypothetical protein